MANEKLTDLTAITEAAKDDYVYLVDVSDTGDDAAGSSKKIKVVDLGAKVLLQEITNSTASEFDFSSIPSGFNRLIIEGMIQSDATGLIDFVVCFFNSDTTTTNYHAQYQSVYNAGHIIGEYAQALICGATCSDSPANSYASVRIVIEDYAGTYLKTATGYYNAYINTDAIYSGALHMASAVTAAITQVRIRTDNHSTDQLKGTLRLYGEK